MTEQTADELLRIIDAYMPTVITGVNKLSEKAHHKRREDWDADDLAVMAAFSAAHNMMKDVSGRSDLSHVDFDLPSVLGLMESLQKRNKAIATLFIRYPETRDLESIFAGIKGRTF